MTLNEAEKELHLLEAERARKYEAPAKANKEYDEIDVKAHVARGRVNEMKKGAKHG